MILVRLVEPSAALCSHRWKHPCNSAKLLDVKALVVEVVLWTTT